MDIVAIDVSMSSCAQAAAQDEIKPYRAIVEFPDGTHSIVEFPAKVIANIEDGIPLDKALLAINKPKEVIVVNMVLTSRSWVSLYEIKETHAPTLR